MNWKTALTVCALLIFPIGFSAAKSYEIIQSRATDNKVAAKIGDGSPRQKKGKRGNRQQTVSRLLKQLDLTPEQDQQIQAIKEKSRTTTRELTKQLQTQQPETQTLLTNNVEIEQLREQHQESQDLLQQLGSNHFESMLEIRTILTDEQKAKIAELTKSRSKKSSDS